jgi:hypothetical protein
MKDTDAIDLLLLSAVEDNTVETAEKSIRSCEGILSP